MYDSRELSDMANASRYLMAGVAGFLVWELLALVLGNQANSAKSLQLVVRGDGEPRIIQRDRRVVITGVATT